MFIKPQWQETKNASGQGHWEKRESGASPYLRWLPGPACSAAIRTSGEDATPSGGDWRNDNVKISPPLCQAAQIGRGVVSGRDPLLELFTLN